MTYKYILVRSDVFEKCNEKSFHKKRSFSDMRKLFTIKYWVLFILLLAICITAIVLFFCLQNKAYSFIPWIFIPIILSIEERYREKLFNPEARRKELLEKANGYKDYLENIENVLSSHGITSAHYGVLRKECETEIGNQSKSYDKLKTRVLDMLIFTPAGIIISGLINKTGFTETNILMALFIIICGAIIVSVISFLHWVIYYSVGYYKDRYLLDVLNELKYKTEIDSNE